MPGVDMSAVRRISLVMYAGGAFGLLCAIFGPDPEPQDHVAFAAIIVMELLAVAVLLSRPRLSVRLLRFGSFVGVLSTCLCVAVARPTNGTPLYTVWPLLLAAYALPRRDFIAVALATLGGLTVAIGGFVPPPARLNLWVDTVLTVGFAGLAVRYLSEGLSAMVGRLGEVAKLLHRTARRDALTGLPNRAGFDEALERELGRAGRTGRPPALVLLDLDHFKEINDTHGHAVGDEALRRFAALAGAELRAGDVLARIGGEEFALLLPETGVADAEAVATRIAGRVRGDRHPIGLTVSGGIAVAARREDADALLRAADRALYAAKAAGRRRLAVAGEPAGARPEIAAIDAPPVPSAGPMEVALDHEDLVWRDPDLMRRVAVVQGLVGVPAILVSELLPGLTGGDRIALLVLGGLLLAQVSILAITRPPEWVFRVLCFTAVPLLCAIVAINDPLSGTPFFFLWPTIYSAYFFGRRQLTALLMAIAVGYAIVLAFWVDSTLPISDFTTVMAPVAIAAFAVLLLRGRLRRLLAELEARLADLRVAATQDDLTGLLNRRAFDDALAREVQRAARSGADLTLLMFDVDRFKELNDRAGHAAGDAALRELGAVLRERLRTGDVAGRLGGEEFGVLLAGCDAAAAAFVATAVHQRLAQRGTVSVSAGIAQLGGGLATHDELLVAADRAMYAAKAAGGATTVTWDLGAAPAAAHTS